jgi:hypothetical protein
MKIINNLNNFPYKATLIISLLLFAFFIRVYNINYDNLWFDEILSFWISDPVISIEESFLRHTSIEQIPFFYHLILKLNFILFSYEANYGRYLSLIFNFLGIIFSTLVCKKTKNDNSYLLVLALLSLNIFLIGYAQEMRPYSLIFFLCSINLYIFCKIENTKEISKFNITYFITFIFFQMLMIISHPFCLIIFFSFSVYLGINFLKKRQNNKTLIISFYFVSIFTLIYLYFLLKNLGSFPDWINETDIKFFTNFYFSKFFGSRIMGLIHLVSLIVLSYIFFKRVIKKNFVIIIFYIIIFLSYFLPILYGYIFQPIIFPRYIIFVLIPIVILLSILSFEIKNKSIKKLFITFLIMISFANHFTESTFKQFFKQRSFYKPNFEEMSQIITSSKIKNYFIEMNFSKDVKSNAYKAINNYINKINVNKKILPIFLEKNLFYNSNKNKSWIICLPTVVKDKCKNNEINFKDNIILVKNVSGIQMILINK